MANTAVKIVAGQGFGYNARFATEFCGRWYFLHREALIAVNFIVISAFFVVKNNYFSVICNEIYKIMPTELGSKD